MRVAHIIGSLRHGGTERQLIELVNRSSDRLDHHVFVLDSENPLASLVSAPVQWIGDLSKRPRSLPSSLATVRRFRKELRDLAPDVVHAHLAEAEVLASIVTPRGVPLVASRRGANVTFRSPLRTRALGLAHRRTSMLICNSRAVEEITRRQDRNLPPTRIIYNGIDLARFTPSPAPSPPPTVALLAQMRPEKGHELFLSAFEALLDQMPEALAVLAGDGPLRDQVESQISNRGLRERVRVLGNVDDVVPVIREAHVVCLTSSNEGLPNVLLEAMASGRPVVAADVGGVSELVTDGNEGFLCGREPGVIADRLRTILGDEALQERMGRAGTARASLFGWDQTVDGTIAAYDEVTRAFAARSR